MLKAIHAQESRDAADRKVRAIVDDLRAAMMNTAADLAREPPSDPCRWRVPGWPVLSQPGSSSAALHRRNRMVDQALHLVLKGWGRVSMFDRSFDQK